MGDGHTCRARAVAARGSIPAIATGRSLIRVMADIISPEQSGAAAALRRIWSAYEEHRDLFLMGAYAAGGDPMIDEAIARRPDLLAFIRQTPKERVAFADSVAALVEAFGS